MPTAIYGNNRAWQASIMPALVNITWVAGITTAARHLFVKAYALACIAFHDSPFTLTTVQGGLEKLRYIFHSGAQLSGKLS